MATQPKSSTGVEEALAPWSAETLDTEKWSDLAPARPGKRDVVKRDEGYWSTTDHEQLYWQAWFAADEPRRATVALMHGYAEHSARYEHVAIALVRSGYNVIGIDARGHGRSTGHRGHVSRFSRYVDDLALLKRRALDRWPDQPLFLMGHSNGGLITLRYALRKPDGVCGFVVTSPLIQLALRVSAVQNTLGQVTSRLAPKLMLPSEIDAKHLSHVDEVVDRYRQDPLVFDTVNVRWFTEMHETSADLVERADALEQPFLFLVAGSDRVVDARATESLFHKLGSMDRELEVFPDLYHEILNERPWKPILQRVILWMERHRQQAQP